MIGLNGVPLLLLQSPDVEPRADTLYVVFDDSKTAGYGDTPTLSGDYRPQLGERTQRVVRAVDRQRMEAGMRGSICVRRAGSVQPKRVGA